MNLDTLPDIHTLIAAVDQAQSPNTLIEAVTALAEAQSVTAIPTLMAVLGFNNPGAALVAMQGLIGLGEVAVPHLLAGLDGYNYGARAYAIRALAAIGHPDALSVLTSAALSDFAPSVRRAATKGLGTMAWELMPQTQVLPAQTDIVTTLETLTHESDWALRYAVVVAAAGLVLQVPDKVLKNRLLDLLHTLAQTDPDVAVRARVQQFAMTAPAYRHLVSPTLSAVC